MELREELVGYCKDHTRFPEVDYWIQDTFRINKIYCRFQYGGRNGNESITSDKRLHF